MMQAAILADHTQMDRASPHRVLWNEFLPESIIKPAGETAGRDERGDNRFGRVKGYQ